MYWAMAREMDTGYADNRIWFYLNREPPEIRLECGKSVSGVVVRIGPKVAYVRISQL